MTSKILRTVARKLAASQWAFDTISRLSEKTPYADIIGPDGRLYMRRWWLMPRWFLKESSKGVLTPRAWLPFSIRLHHIVLPDADMHLHDHPFNFRTFVLRGWYAEENIFGNAFVLESGRTARRAANEFHRIADVSSGGVWTLFFMGRRVNDWGFLVGGRKVGFRAYLGGGNGL